MRHGNGNGRSGGDGGIWNKAREGWSYHVARGVAVGSGIGGDPFRSIRSRRTLAFSPVDKKDARESPFAKLLIGGGVTIFFEICGGHALEIAKIAKQTSTDSYLQIMRNMTAEQGLRGLLSGFFPWGALQCTIKGSAMSFGSAQAMWMLHGNDWLSPGATTILSGGIGGAIQGICMSPALLLKTRVITDPAFRKKMSGWEATVVSTRLGADVIQREGFMALTKGMGIFATKRFFDWTTRYAFVVMVENMMRKEGEKLSQTQKVTAALAGGSLSALSTIPLDVMVATSQQAAKAGTKVTMLDTVREQLASGGVSNLIQKSTRGLVARVAHVALTTLLMKQVTSMVYDVLYR